MPNWLTNVGSAYKDEIMPNGGIGEVTLRLRSTREGIGKEIDDIKIQGWDQAGQHRELNGKIDNIQRVVDKIEKDTRFMGPSPADFCNALGGVATSIKNSVVLGQAGYAQESAAEGFRSAAALCKAAATVFLCVPPPVGEVGGAIIESFQGLFDFTATLLDLTKPERHEKTLEEVVEGALEAAFMEKEINDIFGATLHFDLIETEMQSAIRNKVKVPTLPEAFAYTTFIGDGGSALALDKSQSWLKHEDNWKRLDEDKWATVFDSYVLARQKYLQLYIYALQLLEPQVTLKDGTLGDNPQLKIAFDVLAKVFDDERKFIEEITPIAVSKAMSFNGGPGVHLCISKSGFRANGWSANWRRGPSPYDNIVTGPGRRLWCLAGGDLYTIKVNDDGSCGPANKLGVQAIGGDQNKIVLRPPQAQT
jgi:hypothetical protein